MSKLKKQKSVLNQNNSTKHPKEFRKIQNLKSELLWVIVIVIFAAIMLISRDFFLTFTVFLVFIAATFLLLLIPLISILIKITLRTKCSDFAFQLFIYLQLIPIGILGIADMVLIMEKQSIWEPSVFWFPLVLFPGLLIFQLNRIKKPIFWNKALNNYKAPIISRQSVQIIEEQDGYSQRPVSLKFQPLKDFIPSPSSFKEQIENYCIFLGRQGELIDWHIEESFAILYPRFLIHAPNLLKPLEFYQFLRRLFSKRNLTSIEISLSPAQISLNIAFQDYSILNREVTFHILSVNILESVTQSLNAYFHNDLEGAYQKLIGRIGEDSSSPN